MLENFDSIESYLDWLCNSEEYVEYKLALENSQCSKNKLAHTLKCSVFQA